MDQGFRQGLLPPLVQHVPGGGLPARRQQVERLGQAFDAGGFFGAGFCRQAAGVQVSQCLSHLLAVGLPGLLNVPAGEQGHQQRRLVCHGERIGDRCRHRQARPRQARQQAGKPGDSRRRNLFQHSQHQAPGLTGLVPGLQQVVGVLDAMVCGGHRAQLETERAEQGLQLLVAERGKD